MTGPLDVRGSQGGHVEVFASRLSGKGVTRSNAVEALVIRLARVTDAPGVSVHAAHKRPVTSASTTLAGPARTAVCRCDAHSHAPSRSPVAPPATLGPAARADACYTESYLGTTTSVSINPTYASMHYGPPNAPAPKPVCTPN